MHILDVEVRVVAVLDAVLSYHHAQIKDVLIAKDDAAFYKAEAAREIAAVIIGYAEKDIQPALRQALNQRIDAACANQFFMED